MASPETTFFGIFTAAGKGTTALIAARFYPANNVPQGAAMPRGHYDMGKDFDYGVNGAVGKIDTTVTVQWVAATHAGAVALARAAWNCGHGYSSATVQTCILESESPVMGPPDDGSSEGLYVVEQKWKFNMSDSVPTLT
jgi:hypothetical protein